MNMKDKLEASANKSSTGSLRFNSGKPELSQLDPRFLIDLAELMTKSAKKYGKYNWCLGQEFHTPYDSAQRHLLKFMSGENVDDESGLNHLIHAAANLMIMYTSQKLNNKDLDTRFNWEPEKENDPSVASFKTHNGLTDQDLESMSEEQRLLGIKAGEIQASRNTHRNYIKNVTSGEALRAMSEADKLTTIQRRADWEIAQRMSGLTDQDLNKMEQDNELAEKINNYYCNGESKDI